jgi:hypothetical protein
MKRVLILTGVATLLVVNLGLWGATAAHATVPGANGRIAFARFADATFSHSDIIGVNPDGTGVVKLTHARDGVFTRADRAGPAVCSRWLDDVARTRTLLALS